MLKVTDFSLTPRGFYFRSCHHPWVDVSYKVLPDGPVVTRLCSIYSYYGWGDDTLVLLLKDCDGSSFFAPGLALVFDFPQRVSVGGVFFDVDDLSHLCDVIEDNILRHR